MKAILKHIADSTVTVTIDNLTLETSKEVAKTLRVDNSLDITAATLNRIIKNKKSSAGFNIEVEGALYPWSDRDIKVFGITEAIQPSFENISQIVAEEAVQPVVEAVAAVAEVIVEKEETEDADDLTAGEGVNWMRRNPKGPQELLKVRKSSKVWEIIVALKKRRMTLKELQEALYAVGLDEDQIDDYKVIQAMYDVMWKGYNIAKITCADGEVRYAIRTLDFKKVESILTY